MTVTINNGEKFCGFCAEHEDSFQGDEFLFANENPVELTDKLILNDNSSDHAMLRSCYPASVKQLEPELSVTSHSIAVGYTIKLKKGAQ